MAKTNKNYITSKRAPSAYRIIMQEQHGGVIKVHGEKEKKGEFVKDTNYYKSLEQLVRAEPHYSNVLVNGQVLRYTLVARAPTK